MNNNELQEALRLAEIWTAHETVDRGMVGDDLDAIARALLAEHAARMEYENCITWDTTCKNCANLMDKNYEAFARTEQAEARVKELEEALCKADHELAPLYAGANSFGARLQSAKKVIRDALSPFPKPKMEELR